MTKEDIMDGIEDILGMQDDGYPERVDDSKLIFTYRNTVEKKFVITVEELQE